MGVSHIIIISIRTVLISLFSYYISFPFGLGGGDFLVYGPVRGFGFSFAQKAL